MFSQRRLPSHDLEWVDFWMVRPEDMKPGIISTGLCGLWLLLPFVFFADNMFCMLLLNYYACGQIGDSICELSECYNKISQLLIPDLIYLTDFARSFLSSLPVIGCTVASNYTAHDEEPWLLLETHSSLLLSVPFSLMETRVVPSFYSHL